MSEDKIPEDVQQKIGQLQMFEQNMQNFNMQRQVMQTQLLEVESALDELSSTDEVYKIVGNIMVAAKKDELSAELKEKQELLKARVSSLESQEKNLMEKAENLQKELMKSMK